MNDPPEVEYLTAEPMPQEFDLRPRHARGRRPALLLGVVPADASPFRPKR